MRTANRMKKKRGKRIGRLKSASDVRAFIARCIRESAREGGTSSTVHYRNVMMATMLLKAIEVSAIEERINKLEQTIAGVK